MNVVDQERAPMVLHSAARTRRPVQARTMAELEAGSLHADFWKVQMTQRDDLVKVLRDYGNHGSHDGPELYGEAADEIERLRADIREAQKATSDVVEAMRAEIERLKDDRSRWWADNKRLLEDNDRLRAAMREAQKATSDVGVAMSNAVVAMSNAVVAMQAEIERLRRQLTAKTGGTTEKMEAEIERLRNAAAAERERCARVCFRMAEGLNWDHSCSEDIYAALRDAAFAIRKGE